MNRRRTDFQTLDLAAWPGVAYTEFADEERRAFQLRVNAIQRYAQGESIGDIELATGVNRRQLYRLLDRGLAQHPDGRKLKELQEKGHPVDAEVLKVLSPYRREHINRLGDYLLDLLRSVPPLDPTIDFAFKSAA